MHKMHQGCLRPMLLSTAMLLAFVIVLVLIYWDTFGLMFANMMAMGEGRHIAEQMHNPDDLLEYIAAHPESVSLVAFDLDDRDAGIFYQADVPRPVAGLPRLLVLAAYARHIDRGELSASQPVALATLERLVMPGVDRMTLDRTLQGLAERGRLAGDSLALEHVVEAMIQWNTNAATDLVIDLIGRERLETLPNDLGLPQLSPPMPNSGTFLSWYNHTVTTPPKDRLAHFNNMADDAYADEVYRLMHTYRNDASFYAAETTLVNTKGTDLSLRQQRALAHTTFPRGTAAGYASLLERALSDSLISSEASRLFLRHLEHTLPDSTAALVRAVGSEAGSFPGLISFAGYAVRSDHDKPRVVVLLMQDVPISVFYHLMQTGIDKVFEIQLLGDDAFFERVRRRLRRTS